MSGLNELKKELEQLRNPKKAKLLQGFFKTGKGEYGEGDIFFGITVPQSREVAKKYWQNINFQEIQELLNTKNHEYRFVALLFLMDKYKQAKKQENILGQKEIFDFYLDNAKKGNINNWDLVDLSCIRIVGDYLINKNRNLLYKLAKSKNVWERRISIISTAAFIREKKFSDTIKISEILLKDEHDLIHKAVGWMLREVGKKDKKVLLNFLNKYSKIMPRTALRYSIERLSEKQRKYYLSSS